MPAILNDRRSHDLIEAIHDQANQLDGARECDACLYAVKIQ
jgi:hypothetical protein